MPMHYLSSCCASVIGAVVANSHFVRDPSGRCSRSARVVWEYSILPLSMAALVKSAALPKERCRICMEMLRQQ